MNNNDEDPDDLMPEIITATQDAITSEEEDDEDDNFEKLNKPEPKTNINSNEMFSDDEEPEETPILKISPVKPETEEVEEPNIIETPKPEIIKVKPNDNRKKQLEHLKRMREKKKQLALEKALAERPKTPEEPEEPDNFEKLNKPERTKTFTFNSNELDDLVNKITDKSIQNYKEHKKKKKEKAIVIEKEEPKPEPVNPINNLIHKYTDEELIYRDLFF
tara:strand:+ start:6 stop:662 length:657 start_codon:yes stop_codon:yes gene_type:complete